MAEEFLQNGSKVILNCRESVHEMELAANSLKKISPDVYCYKADVSVYGECEGMFGYIFNELGGLDVLINNAGVSHTGLTQLMGPDEIDRVINVNLCGAVYCSKLATPHFIKKKSGAILNISSVWGETGASCEAVYSASKGGLNAFTKALAKELGPAGVRVNAIACGAVETDMNSWMTAEEKNAFIKLIPLGRFGKPGEIAKLAYFLAGCGSSYITGQVIRADGGLC